jgi:AraC-like DNA-binding protein
LTFVVAAAAELAGRRVVPREVHLPYPRPTDVAELARTLGGTLIFERTPGALVFETSDLELPVVGADPTLGGYLNDLAEKVLQAMPRAATFQDRVRRAIWSGLRSGRIDLACVAADLAVSARTAQRRLRDEGTSYAALLDDVRRELAMSMLRGKDVAVYEVAFLLGYAEPSTFHRAFRRWTGTSPREFRRAAS